MDSEYDVVWTKNSREDLRGIERDIWQVSLWMPSVRKWSRRIVECGENLRTAPESTHKFTYTARDNIWQATVGKYAILYQVQKKKREVRILRIVYSRANMRRVKLGLK